MTQMQQLMMQQQAALTQLQLAAQQSPFAPAAVTTSRSSRRASSLLSHDDDDSVRTIIKSLPSEAAKEHKCDLNADKHELWDKLWRLRCAQHHPDVRELIDT